MKPNYSHTQPSTRTTLALKETIKQTEARLDFRSALALAYAQTWLVRAGSLKVPSAGIVRRALVVYAGHLAHAASEEATGPAREVREVRRACSAMRVSEEDQRAALQRLEEAPMGEPLPPLHRVRYSPESLAESAAITDRAAATVEQVLRSLSPRRSTQRKARP